MWPDGTNIILQVLLTNAILLGLVVLLIALLTRFIGFQKAILSVVPIILFALSAWVVVYTGGKTIMIGMLLFLLIILYFIFFKSKDILGKPNFSNKNLHSYAIIAGAVLVFTTFFSQYTRIDFNNLSYHSLPFYDDITYSKMIDHMFFYGKESCDYFSNPMQITQLIPYHYLDLWLAGTIAHIFNIPTIFSYSYVLVTLLYFLSSISFFTMLSKFINKPNLVIVISLLAPSLSVLPFTFMSATTPLGYIAGIKLLVIQLLLIQVFFAYNFLKSIKIVVLYLILLMISNFIMAPFGILTSIFILIYLFKEKQLVSLISVIAYLALFVVILFLLYKSDKPNTIDIQNIVKSFSISAGLKSFFLIASIFILSYIPIRSIAAILDRKIFFSILLISIIISFVVFNIYFNKYIYYLITLFSLALFVYELKEKWRILYLLFLIISFFIYARIFSNVFLDQFQAYYLVYFASIPFITIYFGRRNYFNKKMFTFYYSLQIVISVLFLFYLELRSHSYSVSFMLEGKKNFEIPYSGGSFSFIGKNAYSPFPPLKSIDASYHFLHSKNISEPVALLPPTQDDVKNNKTIYRYENIEIVSEIDKAKGDTLMAQLNLIKLRQIDYVYVFQNAYELPISRWVRHNATDSIVFTSPKMVLYKIRKTIAVTILPQTPPMYNPLQSQVFRHCGLRLHFGLG